MDSWALGVLLYTLVYGTMPFDGGDHKNLIRQISNGEYKEPTQSSGNAETLAPLLQITMTKQWIFHENRSNSIFLKHAVEH